MFYVSKNHYFCAPLYLDCVIQCPTAAKGESTPLLSPSTSTRMNLSLTRASTCSTEPSLQRAVSKIWTNSYPSHTVICPDKEAYKTFC